MTTQTPAPSERKPWNDPSLWVGISTGHCEKCGVVHVLRNRLCWACENTKTDSKATGEQP